MELHIPEIELLKNELLDIKKAISKIKIEKEDIDYEDSNMVISHTGSEVVIKYKFKADTLVRKHIAADYLGVKIKEIDELIERGLLVPDGRKRFKMAELLTVKEILN